MTRGRWVFWIIGGSVVAAATASAIAIGAGWIFLDGGPSRWEVLTVGPFGTMLMLGVVAWLDQLIWPQARPLPPRVTGFRVSLAALLGLAFLLAFLASALTVLGLSKERPDEAMVLALPKNLTVVKRDWECGSQACGVSYDLSTPDNATPDELTARLWRHLESKGWQRLRPDASCRDIGWIQPVHHCLFIQQDELGGVTLLLSTELDLPAQ